MRRYVGFDWPYPNCCTERGVWMLGTEVERYFSSEGIEIGWRIGPAMLGEVVGGGS